MLDPPKILHTTAQHIAVIHLQIAKHEIQTAMGPGIKELMSTVAAQGLKPTGPWFTHHHKIMPDRWDFEIGVPVPTPVKAEGRVMPAQWSATKVARTVLHGDYSGLGPAWGELGKWITENGHIAADDLYEVYLAGPESGPDPKSWRTELNRPLR